MFHAFAAGLAERLAKLLAEHAARGMASYGTGHAQGSEADRQAAYMQIMSLIYAQGAAMAGGERVYFPQSVLPEREQSRQRIALALGTGEPAQAIAMREGVSLSLVKKVRRARGTIRP